MKIGLIRCEKNEAKCPLTNCIKCYSEKSQAFERYDESSLIGIFTCRCPGDNFSEMVKVLKVRGAEVVHIVTCTVAGREDGRWVIGDGFCECIEELSRSAAKECCIPVVIGTAHLPEGYSPVHFE